MKCFVFALLFPHGLQSLLETGVRYFWLTTVLGFRGPPDSESYMPTGVSLKVLGLIGCILLAPSLHVSVFVREVCPRFTFYNAHTFPKLYV